MKIFARLKDNCDARRKLARRDEIVKAFDVDEYEGAIYITCNGVAIYQADTCTTSEDILDQLAEMREAALKHAGLC